MQKQVILILLLLLLSCKNHYNDMITWADNLNKGIDIELVKKRQPDFIEIDWQNAQIDKDTKKYLIRKVKGSKDILGMSHYLVFRAGKYEGREPHK